MTAVYVGVGEGLGVERRSVTSRRTRRRTRQLADEKEARKLHTRSCRPLTFPGLLVLGHEYVSECRGLPGAPQPLRRQLRRAVGSGTGTGDKQQTEVQHLGSAERQQSVYQAHLPGEALVSVSSYTLVVLHSQESRLTAPQPPPPPLNIGKLDEAILHVAGPYTYD